MSPASAQRFRPRGGPAHRPPRRSSQPVKQASSAGLPWRDKRRCVGSAGSDPGDLAAVASFLYLNVMPIDRSAPLLPQLGWFCHRAAALRVSMTSGMAHLAGASRPTAETTHATIRVSVSAIPRVLKNLRRPVWSHDSIASRPCVSAHRNCGHRWQSYRRW